MKQIVINREYLETRIALAEDGKIQEYYIQREDNRQIVGSIFKGKITNLESSLQAAFVDIGLEKNAFLHYWDMLPATKDCWDRDDEDEEDDDDTEEDSDSDDGDDKPATGLLGKIVGLLSGNSPAETEPSHRPKRHRSRRGKGRKQQNNKQPKMTVDDIPDRFGRNSEVIVQVTKGPIGTKGPRVTTNLSLPGRYVVLMPNSTHRGVSKRINDREEKDRLRAIIRRLKLPRGMGLICRTAAVGLDEAVIRSDVQTLLDKWNRTENLIRTASAPACIYEEPDLLERTIRDMLCEDIDEITVDDKRAHDRVQTYVRKLDKKDRTKVRLYDHPKPIFQHYNLRNQIQHIFQRKVTMASGAELCIDETEALVAIDINSGKSRKGKSHPETILNTNLEAAAEVARQLRLRNIGGLVVVDFIDMRSRKDQDKVYQCMQDSVARDRAKTRITRISRLGLMEMTRQREHESLKDSIYEQCHYCNGRGVIKSSLTVSVEIQRRLQELLRRRRGKAAVRVTVHPDVLERLRNEDAQILEQMEREFGGDLTFRSDADMHHEEVEFTDPNSGKSL